MTLRLRSHARPAYSVGRIAIEIAFSLVPLIWSTNGLAERSNFTVFRMPSQSVAPLKALGYCFASGAASTALQAAGSEAIVIGGFGFGGVGGGFGCSTESLNQ